MRSNSGIVLPVRAQAALAEALKQSAPPGSRLELRLRLHDHGLNCREFSAYLALVDGVYGRLSAEGYRTYVQQRHAQLAIAHLRSGSVELSFLFDLLSQEAWKGLVVYVILKAAPAIIRGEAAKNFAEAAKSGAEAYRIVRPYRGAKYESALALEVAGHHAPAKLSRRQRQLLRDIVRADDKLSHLNKNQTKQLIRAVEEILSQEQNHLPAALRFHEGYVIDIALHLRKVDTLSNDDEN